MSTTACCQHPGGRTFSNINSEIIVFSLIAAWQRLIFALRKDLALLDVLTLGKEQAINLGVDYDRCIRRLLLGVTLCIAVATAVVGYLFPRRYRRCEKQNRINLVIRN
ncbi:MAG: iron chelate uptake ABC transporter family permease subunit, partial [Flavonifractor plautii]